jgi:hypothetical protein
MVYWSDALELPAQFGQAKSAGEVILKNTNEKNLIIINK